MYPPSTQKLLTHLPALAGMARRVAVAAGAAIMDHYDPSGFQGVVDLKDDQSPVTEADRVADALIRKQLSEYAPGVPFVTEETVDHVDRAALADADHYWLVDGLDGTKAFRKGEADFTVNIALIHHNQPVLGVIYAPALGEGFVGIPGHSAIKFRDDQTREDTISVRTVPREGITLLTSITPSYSPFTRHLMDQLKIARHIKRHSSIKYCDVACARGDVMVAARDIYFWDTAAGDAIVRAAGGAVVGLDGQPLQYDRNSSDFLNHGIVACGEIAYVGPVIDEINALLKIQRP